MFSAYVKGHVEQYLCHMEREDINDHLQAVGETLQFLLMKLITEYFEEPICQGLARIFEEHLKQKMNP